MNRLWVRLTLAFGLVTLVSMGMLTFITDWQAGRHFRQFIVQEVQTSADDMSVALANSYQSAGGWTNIPTANGYPNVSITAAGAINSFTTPALTPEDNGRAWAALQKAPEAIQIIDARGADVAEGKKKLGVTPLELDRPGDGAPPLRLSEARGEWGSCNHRASTIRLNTELVKKPKDLLEYVIVHEMVHLLEPTHNVRFVALIDRFMPKWQNRRRSLNSLPLRHESWDY